MLAILKSQRNDSKIYVKPCELNCERFTLKKRFVAIVKMSCW